MWVQVTPRNTSLPTFVTAKFGRSRSNCMSMNKEVCLKNLTHRIPPFKVTQSHGGELQNVGTTVRKMLRLDRNAHLTAVCEEIEEYQRRNRTKDTFATVNRLTKQACPSVKSVKSESGETLTEQAEIMNRWKNYCEILYSTCEPVEEMKLEGEREPTPTYGEVEKAIKSMKTRKAEGPDEIPAELLKLGGETVTAAMHRLITHVWITRNWPEDWTQSTFVPLFKKGDLTVCANYRTISLISHASKVLLKVILDRMRDKVEFEVAEEQAGFRPNRGTMEHLCNLRLLTERAKARRQPLYLCFIDFEKAFDTISHKKLWKGMLSMGFAPYLVSLIKSV